MKKILTTLLIIAFIIPTTVFGGIVFDTSTNGGLNPGNSTTWEWNHTTTSNADTLMYVSCFGDVGNDTITGATYNSVSMTLIHKIQEPGSRWWYAFYLIAPASGTNEVQVTSSSSIRIACDSATIEGAKQSGQPDAQNTNSTTATSITTSITVVANNSWVFSGARSGSGAWTAGTGLTMLQNHNGLFLADSNGTVSSGSSSYTFDNAASNPIGMGVASFAPLEVAAVEEVSNSQVIIIGM